jgi:hypothetical protein
MAKRSDDQDNDLEQAIAPSFWGNTPAERTIWLALGYMEAAAHLANALVKDEFTRQYRSSRVVLHLTHHAIELFLKGALMEKGLPPRVHHRIADLHADYQQAYPGVAFELSIPFELPGPETEALFPEIAIPRKPLDDQLFRYATARDGRCFDDQEKFEPEVRLRQIEELNARMTYLFFKFCELRGKPFGQRKGAKESSL